MFRVLFIFTCLFLSGCRTEENQISLLNSLALKLYAENSGKYVASEEMLKTFVARGWIKSAPNNLYYNDKQLSWEANLFPINQEIWLKNHVPNSEQKKQILNMFPHLGENSLQILKATGDIFVSKDAKKILDCTRFDKVFLSKNDINKMSAVKWYGEPEETSKFINNLGTLDKVFETFYITSRDRAKMQSYSDSLQWEKSVPEYRERLNIKYNELINEAKTFRRQSNEKWKNGYIIVNNENDYYINHSWNIEEENITYKGSYKCNPTEEKLDLSIEIKIRDDFRIVLHHNNDYVLWQTYHPGSIRLKQFFNNE